MCRGNAIYLLDDHTSQLLMKISSLHFTGPLYDFTLYNLEGADRPSALGSVYVNPGTFTIPQYTYRLAYYLTDRLAISGGMDHMKYVVT